MKKIKSISKLIFCTLAIFLISNIFVFTHPVESKGNFEEIKLGIWSNRNISGTYDWDDLVKKRSIFPYEWEVGGKTYRITPENISIFNFVSKLENIDVLLIDGGTNIEFPFGFMPENNIIKDQKDVFENFIIDGGGYVGCCGGSTLPLKLASDPSSFYESCVTKSSFLDEENYDSKV
jgi:hypothetical protein